MKSNDNIPTTFLQPTVDCFVVMVRIAVFIANCSCYFTLVKEMLLFLKEQ